MGRPRTTVGQMKKKKCGPTHYACDCVMDQLAKADALAKACEALFVVEHCVFSTDAIADCMDEYRKARGK